MGETNLLRAIPKVDELLRRPELSALDLPASTLREAVRAARERLCPMRLRSARAFARGRRRRRCRRCAA